MLMNMYLRLRATHFISYRMCVKFMSSFIGTASLEESHYLEDVHFYAKSKNKTHDPCVKNTRVACVHVCVRECLYAVDTKLTESE